MVVSEDGYADYMLPEEDKEEEDWSSRTPSDMESSTTSSDTVDDVIGHISRVVEDEW